MKEEVQRRGAKYQVDHIWHQPIMQAEDANEINDRCHGDLMLRDDGSLSNGTAFVVWPLPSRRCYCERGEHEIERKRESGRERER